MTDNTTKRIDWVDAAKGVGILMVMFGHNWLDARYCFYLYAFHMPLFFLLAGYTFSDKRNLKVYILQKSKVLLIPYFIFAACHVVFYSVLKTLHTGSYDIVGEVVNFLFQRRHTYLWFLPVLFWGEIVVYVLSRLNLMGNILMGGVNILLLIVLHSFTILLGCQNLVWNIDLVPMASSFIILGWMYKQHGKKHNKVKLSWHSIAFIFIVSLILSAINYLGWGMVDIRGNKYGNYFLFYPVAILCSLALICLLRQIRCPHWLLFIGANSLVYYGLHRFVIELLFVVWGKCEVSYDGVSFLSLIIAVINVIITCTILTPIVLFINKRSPWLLGKF